MSRLLFTTLPSNDLGLLTRSLPIARELRNQGHEIAFSSPQKAPDKLIKEAGFPNLTPKHPLYQIKNFYDLFSPKGKNGNLIKFWYKLLWAIPLKFAPATAEVWNMDHAAAMAGMMNKNFVYANCEAYRKLIIEFDPDIVVDFWNPFACIAAKVLKKPLITVIQADGHPGNTGLIWWKQPAKKLPSALATVNKVMGDYKLQNISKMEELNLGDLTLVLGTPITDPVPEGASCHHVGTILWENSKEVLPAFIQNINNEKPLIWIYSGNPAYSKKGTVIDSGIIIEVCTRTLSQLEVNVILTTGHHQLPDRFLPLPKNFHFYPYLPGLLLAERCDLMIHHGGFGSCQTGMYTGTPALIIPTFSERESNARRVVSLGVAEMVVPKTISNKKKDINLNEFREKFTQILEDPKYLVNAKRYQDLLRSFDGAKRAAELIDNICSKRRQ